MRVRHVALFFLVTLALAGMLAGCSFLDSVSIDQRVTQFQADLNAADRSSLYLNFHPDLTSDFEALKDPTTTIDPLIPVLQTGDASYSLTATDKTDSSAVLVTMEGGPANFAPKYLKLDIQTTGFGDNRIVKLWFSPTMGQFDTAPVFE